MTTTTRRLSLLLLPTLLLGGCASVQRLAAAAFTPPRLHLERARVAEVDLEGAAVVLDLTIENPNDLALRVARASWRLQVEGAQVSEGQLPGGLALPARGTAPFALTVRIRWADLTRLAEQLRHQATVAYRIDGTVGVETPLGVLSPSFKHQGQVPVPRLPALRLAGVSADMHSLTNLELELALEVENPNAFPLPGAVLRFDLLVNGVVVASGREVTLSPLRAGGETRLKLPIGVSLLGAGRAAASIHGGAEVRLRGTVQAGGLEAPLDLRIDVGRR
jgi:LEA14-like dessication related protein